MERRKTAGALVLTALGVIALAGAAVAQLPADPTPQHREVETTLRHGANSFAESQAHDLLVQQGYSNISPLMNGKDGVWRGKAVKNDKTFDVSVDYQGQVAAK